MKTPLCENWDVSRIGFVHERKACQVFDLETMGGELGKQDIQQSLKIILDIDQHDRMRVCGVWSSKFEGIAVVAEGASVPMGKGLVLSREDAKWLGMKLIELTARAADSTSRGGDP